MKITHFDGEHVWFEQWERKWTTAEILLRHEHRVRDAMLELGMEMEWDEDKMGYDFMSDSWVNRPGVSSETARVFYLEHPVQADRIHQEQVGDFREANGWRRSDAKPLMNRIRKVALDKLADELGVATNEDGWEALTIETLEARPAKGLVNVDC